MIVIATTKSQHSNNRRQGVDVTVEMSIGRIEFGDIGGGLEHESVEEAAFSIIAKHGAQHGLDSATYRFPVTDDDGILEIRTRYVPGPRA